MKKIISIDKLLKIKGQKKIVLCHGVFDVVHFGHLSHFKASKKFGDILVVSITEDKFVNKGPGRPVFNSKIRASFLSNLDCVDYVFINNSKTPIDLIKKLKPNYYSKGIDYKDSKKDITGEIKNEIKAIKNVGGKIIFTDEFSSSSSKLINSYLDVLDDKQKKFVNKLKKFSSNIDKYFEQFKKLKILVIGETIIDHYYFCEALGKSGKDPILAIKENYNKEYVGGSAAVAINLSNFCRRVKFISSIGNEKKYLKMLKEKFNKNISFNYVVEKERPTILKKRYIDEISNNKLLSVYNIEDSYLKGISKKKFFDKIKQSIKKSDVVIVSDYGHGLIGSDIADYICKHSKFLAVNAQINAANRGFHSLSNYKKKNDLIIVNESELRHEMRDKRSEIKILMKKFSKQNSFKFLIITRGSLGAILYNSKNNKFFSSEAFAKKIVDKIGSGDSMLALSSLALASGLNENLSLFFGSIAAAQSVENFGNSASIDPIKLQKSINHIVK